jgi:hypothetical protein
MIKGEFAELDAALAGRPTERDDLVDLVAAVQAGMPQPSDDLLTRLDGEIEMLTSGSRDIDRITRRHPRRRRWGWALGPVAATAIVAGALFYANPTQYGADESEVKTPKVEMPYGAVGDKEFAEVRPGYSTDLDSTTAYWNPRVDSHKSLGASSEDVVVSGTIPRFHKESAAMALRVDEGNLTNAVSRVSDIAEDGDGFVSRSTVDANGDRGSADLQLQVQRKHLPEVLDRLADLGSVLSLRQESEDVTGPVREAADTERQLRTILKRTTNQLANETDPVRIRQLRQLQTQQRRDVQRAMKRNDEAQRIANTVPINLNIQAAPDTSSNDITSIDGAWNFAKRALTGMVSLGLIALVVIGPLAIVLGGIWWLRRRRGPSS